MSDIISKSLSYLLTSASKSQAIDKAKEEFFSAFWAWVRPFFIYDVPDIETNGDDPTTKQKTEARLKVLLQNEDFKKDFLERITELESKVVTEKNIVRKELDGVKKIRIGDTVVNPNEQYDRKNIVEGPVRNSDEFRLGDGN